MQILSDAADHDAASQPALPRYDRRPCAREAHKLAGASTAEGLGRIGLQWLLVAAAIALACRLNHPLAYLLALFVIAGRQVGLLYLQHDAAHYMLFKKARWNDLLANALVSFPLGYCVGYYRAHHFSHHRFTNAKGDPDWAFQQGGDWAWPKDSAGAWRVFGLDLSGLSSLKYLGTYFIMCPLLRLHQPAHPSQGLSRADKILYVLQTGLGLFLLTHFHLWKGFLFFWILPNFTFTVFLHRIRTIAEHHALQRDHELRSTRSVTSNALERFFVAPLGMNYHLEHHLYPQVPGNRLHRLRQILQKDPAFRAEAHITSSYLGPRGLLSEIVGAQGRLEAATAR